MRRFFSFFMMATMLFASIDAFAWGQKGHDVVAYIAEQHLTKKAKKNLNKILDGKSLVYYSNWLDNVQNSPYWTGGYERTKTWHYFNVDRGYTLETMEKNPKGDALCAMNMIIDSLENHNSELTDSVRLDYVRMMIHIVGDIHCPMHVGRKSDRGGNDLKVKWFRTATNLHSVWDSRLVESMHSWTYTEWQQNLDRCTKKEIEQLSAGEVRDWLEETWNISKNIYKYSERGDDYSYQYVFDHQKVVERQLLVAGYRLAALLNRIFG